MCINDATKQIDAMLTKTVKKLVQIGYIKVIGDENLDEDTISEYFV